MKKYNNQINETSAINSGKRKNKKASPKQANANARRKLVKSWMLLARGVKYQKAATKEPCKRTT